MEYALHVVERFGFEPRLGKKVLRCCPIVEYVVRYHRYGLKVTAERSERLLFIIKEMLMFIMIVLGILFYIFMIFFSYRVWVIKKFCITEWRYLEPSTDGAGWLASVWPIGWIAYGCIKLADYVIGGLDI